MHYKYQVCTRDGYLKGGQNRNALEYEPHLTAELMMIDESKAGFAMTLTVTEASKRCNVLGSASACRNTTDCAKIKSCGCIYAHQNVMEEVVKIPIVAYVLSKLNINKSIK